MIGGVKVCIYGAGAIGGFLGARIAATGLAQVSAVARGATLEALKRSGFELRLGGSRLQAPVRAAEDPRVLGDQDLVIIAVKGQAMPQVAAHIGPLLAANTTVLAAMNGVPWWFLDALPGPLKGARLEAVDPRGVVSAAIPARRALGCVVHLSATSPAPGVIEHRSGNGLIVGEPGGAVTPRLAEVSKLLADAGFDVTRSNRIEYDIWYKLWGNMTMNPVSALTGATGDRILDDPLVRDFCSAAMREAAAIGERIGCPVTQSPEERHAITRKLGALRTSMLQDAEAGKSLEIDPIVAVVKEIGGKVGVATPNIDALLGLIRLFARVRGLHPDGSAGARSP
jgi:2-dehydropantoate 2-reductase